MSQARTQHLIETVLGVHDTPEGHTLSGLSVHSDGSVDMSYRRPDKPWPENIYNLNVDDPAGNLLKRKQKSVEDSGYARPNPGIAKMLSNDEVRLVLDLDLVGADDTEEALRVERGDGYVRPLSDGQKMMRRLLHDGEYADYEYLSRRFQAQQGVGVREPAMTPSDADPEEPASVVYPQVPPPPPRLPEVPQAWLGDIRGVIREGHARRASKDKSEALFHLCLCRHCQENGNR